MCFRRRPGAAGGMASEDVLATHRPERMFNFALLQVQRKKENKGNYIHILFCWNRAKYVLLRRKKLTLQNRGI